MTAQTPPEMFLHDIDFPIVLSVHQQPVGAILYYSAYGNVMYHDTRNNVVCKREEFMQRVQANASTRKSIRILNRDIEIIIPNARVIAETTGFLLGTSQQHCALNLNTFLENIAQWTAMHAVLDTANMVASSLRPCPQTEKVEAPEPRVRRTILLPEPLMQMPAQTTTIEFASSDEEQGEEEEEKGLQCSICYADAKDYAPLCEHTTDDTLVIPPCGNIDHAMCGRCVRRHATNWSNHSISFVSPHVTCPYEGCGGVYPTERFKKFLTPGDFDRLSALQARFGVCSVKCLQCSTVNFINPADLTDAAQGTIIVTCLACESRFCYHCLNVCPTGWSACPCSMMPNEPMLHGFNRWFVRPDRTLDDPRPPLMRNSELTLDMCVKQIMDVCVAPPDQLTVKCAHCACPMHRTGACSEMTHCGMKKCEVCGISALPNERVIFDHWHSHGIGNTCPRWRSDPFWTTALHGFHGPRCVEGECHGVTIGDCAREDHAPFRAAVADIRRLRMVRAGILSLMPRMRRGVVDRLMHLGDARVSRILSQSLMFSQAQV